MSPSAYHFRSMECGRPNGRPVLFLHGFLGSARDWTEIMRALGPTFRCLAVDLPGHGGTVRSGSDNDYRMGNVARGLDDYLTGRGIRSCSVVGYSLGGRLALYLAVKYPARFEKIVLESASPGLKSEADRSRRLAHDDRLASQLERSSFERFLNDWYDQPLFASLKDDAKRFAGIIRRRLKDHAAGRDRSAELARVLRMLSIARQPSMWKDLPGIRVPVGLIVGELDPKFRGIAAEIAQLCPSVSVNVVAGAGHNVHCEQPLEYARVVGTFLMSQG